MAANLDVLGSTGNVYTVSLGRPRQSCTCVDHGKHPNVACKHILFVMLRVCKLPENDPRVWQALEKTEGGIANGGTANLCGSGNLEKQLDSLYSP